MNTVKPNKELEKKAFTWLAEIESPDLSEEQERSFYQWLNHSPEHLNAYIWAESIWSRGAVLDKVRPQYVGHLNEGCVVALKAKDTGGPTKRETWLKPRRILQASSIAASLFIAVFFAHLMWHTPETTERFIQHQTQLGEQREISLADGTVVTLNTNTKISLPEQFGDTRTVNLEKGEAFFQVSHDQSRPFIVKTAEGLVIVLGTSFSVSKTSSQTTIVVAEGRVGLLPETSVWDGKLPDFQLKRDEKVKLLPGSKPEKVRASQLLSWRSGALVYHNEPLHEVLADLNRYHEQSFQIADPNLEHKVVSAVIPVDNDFESTLNLLKASLQLQSKPAPNSRNVLLYKDNETKAQ